MRRFDTKTINRTAGTVLGPLAMGLVPAIPQTQVDLGVHLAQAILQETQDLVLLDLAVTTIRPARLVRIHLALGPITLVAMHLVALPVLSVQTITPLRLALTTIPPPHPMLLARALVLITTVLPLTRIT